MKDSENPYKLLKVDSEAPLEVVKAAYRALMKSGSLHPDLGGENNLAQEINLAYQILSDAEQRRELDAKLKESKKFVAEEKKETSEYFVVCLHCQSINRILHPQWVKQSQCSQCNAPFIITKKGLQKTTPRYSVKTADIPKQPEKKINENLAQEFYGRKMYFRAIGEYKSLIVNHQKRLITVLKLIALEDTGLFPAYSSASFCSAVRQSNS